MSKARDLADILASGSILSDGVISTTEIDGITATATELNYVDGVTSAIQTQLDAKAPTASPTFTGTVTAPHYAETVYALSGTALDPANGGTQTKTLAANTTFTDSLSSGESMVLMLEAGASYTVTWPTITWVTSSGNTAPTLTAKDTLVFWKVSTTLYGAYVGSYV